MSTVHQSFCRVCNSNCGITVTVDGGVAVQVNGDRDHPVSAGYTCVKGRAQPALLRNPDRLLHSMVRVGEGYVPIPVEQAMDEIAAKLQRILGEHGPRAVASYYGTFITGNATTVPLLNSFMNGIRTPMQFTPIPIDKPGRQIARAMHGTWMAPPQAWDDPDVALLIGANPIVSYTGFPAGNPTKWLTDSQRRGMKLIVIDPRRNEVAKRADIHLQVRPGTDTAVMAAMIRVILREQLYDRAFVTDNVSGVEELARAVAPYEPEVVAHHAGMPLDDLVAAARAWAVPRGFAFAGTGASMSGWGTLNEYLMLNLETLCGHWMRAGERVRNPRTVLPAIQPVAQARSPWPAYGFGEKMRVRGLSDSTAGMPTAALPDEILLEGPGQVRALISCAGNPVAAFPDQLKTIEAMQRLELLVQIDPWMSQTARLAHYVIAPTMSLETSGISAMWDYDAGYGVVLGLSDAAGHYSTPIVERPPGSELIDEWEFYYGLAQRMGVPLEMPGMPAHGIDAVPLDMASKPTTDDLLELMCRGSRVALGEIKQHPGGALFPEPAVHVAPREDGWTGRFDVGNADMVADLGAYAAQMASPEGESVAGEYDLRLICRRHTHVRNSSCNFDETNKGRGYNPAFLHPDDLERLGLVAGDVVDVVSERSSIPAIVQPDETVRPGVVSMAHSYGDGPDRDHEFRKIGSTTGRLMSDDKVFERYSGQPLMSNIPVFLRVRVGVGVGATPSVT